MDAVLSGRAHASDANGPPSSPGWSGYNRSIDLLHWVPYKVDGTPLADVETTSIGGKIEKWYWKNEGLSAMNLWTLTPTLLATELCHDRV